MSVKFASAGKDGKSSGGGDMDVWASGRRAASAAVARAQDRRAQDRDRPGRLKRSKKRNRTYDEVVADMRRQETRLKSKRNPQLEMPETAEVHRAGGEIYVDRDRAAGVTIGSR